MPVQSVAEVRVTTGPEQIDRFECERSITIRGIGSVFLGGLLVSTVFTLILVPVVFSLTLDAKTWLGGRLARMAPAHAGSTDR